VHGKKEKGSKEKEEVKSLDCLRQLGQNFFFKAAFKFSLRSDCHRFALLFSQNRADFPVRDIPLSARYGVCDGTLTK